VKIRGDGEGRNKFIAAHVAFEVRYSDVRRTSKSASHIPLSHIPLTTVHSLLFALLSQQHSLHLNKIPSLQFVEINPTGKLAAIKRCLVSARCLRRFNQCRYFPPENIIHLQTDKHWLVVIAQWHLIRNGCCWVKRIWVILLQGILPWQCRFLVSDVSLLRKLLYPGAEPRLGTELLSP